MEHDFVCVQDTDIMSSVLRHHKAPDMPILQVSALPISFPCKISLINHLILTHYYSVTGLMSTFPSQSLHIVMDNTLLGPEPVSSPSTARPHSPLDPSSQQIRLLSFESLESDGYLKLETFDKENRPAYFALSYEWGPEEPVETISLNGIEFTIRRNLHLALLAIRHNLNIALVVDQNDQSAPSRTERHHCNKILASLENNSGSHRGVYFWIDALCIDQENLSERGHQVGLMADIYSNARLVMVWLGPGLDETFELLGSSYASPRDDPVAIYGIGGDTGDHKHLLDAFVKASYWTRLWIVQEFLLAKNIVFVSNAHLLSWKTIKSKIDESFTFITRHHSISGLFRAKWKREARLLSKDSQDDPEWSAFQDLIFSFRQNSCSQALDRVYSMLGLVDGWRISGRCPIPVDYSLEPIELVKLISMHFKNSSPHEGVEKYFIYWITKALELPNPGEGQRDGAVKVMHGFSRAAVYPFTYLCLTTPGVHHRVQQNLD